ncbi:hypothetical protein U3516DRAFT_673731 [Neocallimastix sp. 'constans']
MALNFKKDTEKTNEKCIEEKGELYYLACDQKYNKYYHIESTIENKDNCYKEQSPCLEGCENLFQAESDDNNVSEKEQCLKNALKEYNNCRICSKECEKEIKKCYESKYDNI